MQLAVFNPLTRFLRKNEEKIKIIWIYFKKFAVLF
jgi:hypothetical protein